MFIPDGKPWASLQHDLSGGTVVHLWGEYDVANAGELGQVLEAARRDRPTRIVIDLTDTTFIDASAADQIVALLREMPAADCSVVLRRPQPIVRRVIGLVGLDRLCRIEDASDEVADIHRLRPSG